MEMRLTMDLEETQARLDRFERDRAKDAGDA